jgi:hypothetical protein
VIAAGDRILLRLWWVDVTNRAGGWHDAGELDEFATDGAWEASNTGWLVYEDVHCYVLAGRMTDDGQHVGLVERVPKACVTRKAVLPAALGEADSPVITAGGTVSLITDLEHAVEKAVGEVEAEVKVLDGQALAELRRLLAEAKAAEARLEILAKGYKAEILALAEKYGPEAVAALEAELGKMLAEFKALFHLG